MFGPAGHAYVYLVYGMHNCLNIVTGEDGQAGAVLIRAVEPMVGLAEMRADSLDAPGRGRSNQGAATGERDRRLVDARLAAGPGLLCRAFGIDRSFTGLDLCSAASPLRLEAGDRPEDVDIARTPRVGVAYAGDPWASIPWRLLVSSSPSVSGRRPPVRRSGARPA